MNHLIEAVARLSGYAVFGNSVDEKIKEGLDDNTLVELYNLSQFHDVAHLVAQALEKLQLLPISCVSDKFRQEIITAFYRYQRLEYQSEKVYNILKENNIPFIPLKGAVIRSYYPETWMRTSCDTDILIKSEDLEAVESLLVDNLSFTKKAKGTHDVTFEAPGEVLIEIHFELVESGRAKNSSEILKSVWEHSFPVKDGESLYAMENELFYFYHIAHIAKHFETGGCGIKPLIDLWLLESRSDYYNEKTIKLLTESNLLTFTNEIRNLCAVWFDGKSHSPLTLKIQEFINSGGVYGTADNGFSIKQIRYEGKAGYILSRIFLPYDLLKLQFPILEKHRLLTPLFEIIRWFQLMFGKKSQNRRKSINALNNVDYDKAEEISKMFKQLDLQ